MDLIGGRTLRDLLEEKVRLRGDATFLVFEDKEGAVRSWTYREFYQQVERVASAFHGLGIAHGDKVTVHLPNSPEFLFCWFGLATLGALMVPSNVANAGDEMVYVINYSDSKILVTQPDYLPMFRKILPECPTVSHVVLARTEQAEEGTVLLSEAMARATAAPPRAKLASEDEMEMLFTSGTTSRPKGVLLTHANALRSGERVSKHIAMRPDDIFLTGLPAFHVNAQSISIMSTLTVGGTLVLLETYSASKFWKQVRQHGATCLSLVPALLRTIATQPVDPDERNHRLRAVFFAINVPDREKEEFEERFGVELINGYGLSETMTIVTMAPAYGEKRWPSIGLPTFDRQVKIVDDEGRELAPGQVGEIVVHGVPGRTLMKGYYKDPEATAQAVRDGWLHTGDNGYMDELGYVYFFDRKKDVIKRAAENVSASEVERVLLEHPGILEAAVIGVPDPIRDEAVKAFLVMKEGAVLTPEAVIAYCATRLAKFKVPSFVEIRPSLPKTSIGKIEKKVLRAEEKAREAAGASLARKPGGT
jgi:crotonobetaine/carnitine-CoA ligase